MTTKTENRRSDAFYVVEEYRQAFTELGLTSIDDVFKFDQGQDLFKKNIGNFRSRFRFQTEHPARTFFLKRYDHPPIKTQLTNWIDGRKRRSCCRMELEPIRELNDHQVCAPSPIAYGHLWGWLFEKKSFLITEEIADGDSLERRLPTYFYSPSTPQTLCRRRNFVKHMAHFIRRFHDLGYRHRDLYFSHIFCDTKDKLYLIDLARAFRPIILQRRFLIKDLAQVFYSMSAQYFSRTDRLRFYLHYAGIKRLRTRDKSLIRSIVNKAKRMARHDSKHGKDVPFLPLGHPSVELNS
jgi:hypothetical protein